MKCKHNTSTRYLGNTIELGAGVGFLGQCLASEGCCKSVVVTETDDVLIHLERNLESNKEKLNGNCVAAHLLDWRRCEKDRKDLSVETFDTILATDVLFSPELVEPLLKTAQLLSKETTLWFLCVQKRCAKSHEEFLARAPEFGFVIEDVSDDLDEWGKAVECVLLRLTRRVKRANQDKPTAKRLKIK